MVLEPSAWTMPVAELGDREDADYYFPPTLDLERRIQRAGGSRLSNLVESRTETPSLDGLTEFPYVDIASVDRRTGLVHPEPVLVEEAPSRAKRLAYPGDVLVALVRPSRNVIAVIDDEVGCVVCSSGFAVLRPVAVSAWALFAFLKSSLFVPQAVRRSSASMYPTISEDELLTVVVPPFSSEEVSARFETVLRSQRETVAAYGAALRASESVFRASLEVPHV